MTPSGKPSRAAVITAGIAMGVFGAGTGLGAVIASRSQPGEGEAMRLAAGTYYLDDGAQAWKPKAKGGNDPVSLSGSDEGSTISGDKKPKNTTLCLAATVGGHVTGGAGGCVALPALASAIAPMQRPGNPKSTTTTAPKKESSPAKSSAPQPTPDKHRGGGGGQSAPDPARPAPVQPQPVQPQPVQPQPVQPQQTTEHPKTAPAPTKKVTGGIADNGSLIDRPAKKPKLSIDSSIRPQSLEDRGVKKTDAHKPAQPVGTLKPALPTGTTKQAPPVPFGTAKPVPPPADTKQTAPVPFGNAKNATPPADTKQAPPAPFGNAKNATPAPSGTTEAVPTPIGSLKPALRTGAPQPMDASDPSQPRPLPATTNAQPPAPHRKGGQTSDGTVLPSPVNGGLPEEIGSLPVFKDPELLRRAQEALGLDKNMRYTDENGVWDLTIAPPGTPPCRDYSAAELRALSSPEGAVIPRDSCLWPAFVRWLYADPAPGQVSNWTKFTGLAERNMELVVTDPAPGSPSPSGLPTGSGLPDTGLPTGSGLLEPSPPAYPDRYSRFEQPGRFDAGQPSPSGQYDPGRPAHQGSGQVEPEPDGYTGQ